MVKFFFRAMTLGVAIVLGYAAMLAFERQANWMLRQEATMSAEAWVDYFVSTVPDYESALDTGELSPTEMATLTKSNRALKAFRFKMFNARGDLTFLSDYYNRSEAEKSAAGLREHNESAFSVIRSGAPFIEVEDGREKPDRPDAYAEVYVPVSVNGRHAGVIEVYVDVTEAKAINEASLARFAGIIGALMLAALAIPVLYNYLAWRKIRETNAALLETRRDLEVRAEKDRENADSQNRMTQEVRLLGNLNEWLQSSRSLGELFELVEGFLTRLLPAYEGSIYTFSSSRDVLDGCIEWNGGSLHAHIRPDECWGLRRGRTYDFKPGEIAFRCEHVSEEKDGQYVCIPLLAHGETVGLLHLRRRDDATEEDCLPQRKLAQVCAEQISMAIANVRMRDELQEKSVRDSLTGLFNRRHMADTLRRHLAIANSCGTSVALLSIDVDHFKKFNDNYGHDAGDMVLRAVGSVLDRVTTGDELACRPGGEEFSVILPETDVSDALFRAEQIREEIHGISLRYGARTLPSITVSIGVAMSPVDGTIPQELIKAADEALYGAKDSGRNQVMLTRLMGDGECGGPQPVEIPGDTEGEPVEVAVSA